MSKLEDFKPSANGVLFIEETNKTCSPVVAYPTTPNTLFAVRQQSYKTSGTGETNNTINLFVFKDAEVNGEGKIDFTHGSNQRNSTLYCKHIRHTPEIAKFINSHKKREQKHATFYDNDVNRALSGSQTWSFNRGLTPEQHCEMGREGIDYLMVQNSKKPNQTSLNVPTYFIIGGHDLDSFCKFINELASYYERLEKQSTNMEHSTQTVKAYLLDAAERKRKSSSSKKNKQLPNKKKTLDTTAATASTDAEMVVVDIDEGDELIE